jgi:hypothetical protein
MAFYRDEEDEEDVDEDGNYSGIMANHYYKKQKEENKDPGEKGADDNE